MSVIPLTIFFSLLLAGLFVALFAWERSRRQLGGTARDSLLPLADETPRPAVAFGFALLPSVPRSGPSFASLSGGPVVISFRLRAGAVGPPRACRDPAVREVRQCESPCQHPGRSL